MPVARPPPSFRSLGAAKLLKLHASIAAETTARCSTMYFKSGVLPCCCPTGAGVEPFPYTLGTKLGEGSEGTVYECKHTPMVAKFVGLEDENQESYSMACTSAAAAQHLRITCSPFMAEIYAACVGNDLYNAFGIENFARLHGVYHHEGHGVLVMERLQEFKSFDFSSFTDLEAAALMFQVCFAIFSMQEHSKTVHQDLHTGNVFIKRHQTRSRRHIRHVAAGVSYLVPDIGITVKFGDFSYMRCDIKKADSTVATVSRGEYPDRFQYSAAKHQVDDQGEFSSEFRPWYDLQVLIHSLQYADCYHRSPAMRRVIDSVFRLLGQDLGLPPIRRNIHSLDSGAAMEVHQALRASHVPPRPDSVPIISTGRPLTPSPEFQSMEHVLASLPEFKAFFEGPSHKRMGRGARDGVPLLKHDAPLRPSIRRALATHSALAEQSRMRRRGSAAALAGHAVEFDE